MDTVELGRTGQRVTHLSLGCMLMGTATDEATSMRMLDRYLEAGGGFLDTANCYAWWVSPDARGDESETLLGRWFARGGRRDEVFLSTKVGGMVREPAYTSDGRPDWSRLQFEGVAAGTVRRSVDESLRRLGTDRIDLLYVHVDDRNTPLEETLEALAGVVSAGKVRYLGWSNVRVWRVERARQLCERYGWPAPVAVQLPHSYLRPRPGLANSSIVDEQWLDYLRANEEVSLVAYSPILKGIYDPAKRQGHWVTDNYKGPDADARLAALDELAAELGANPNQLVVAWLLHQARPAVLPLIGPRTLEQFEDLLPALDIKLDAEQLARLDSAGA
ncbi:MAG TPA: aldo/keto reductase [Rugosimonospora sp.]|nr:aldo/keto reductase [Rugosimonospora sp.]